MGRLRPLRSTEPFHGHAARQQRTWSWNAAPFDLRALSYATCHPQDRASLWISCHHPCRRGAPTNNPISLCNPVTLLCLLDRLLSSMMLRHCPCPGSDSGSAEKKAPLCHSQERETFTCSDISPKQPLSLGLAPFQLPSVRAPWTHVTWCPLTSGTDRWCLQSALQLLGSPLFS